MNVKDIDLDELFALIDNFKMKSYEGWVRRFMGEFLLSYDNSHLTEADDWIQEAIEADKRSNTMWQLGRDYAVYAELFKRKGDRQRAKENLNKAIEILNECGAEGWVEKYEKELADLH